MTISQLSSPITQNPSIPNSYHELQQGLPSFSQAQPYPLQLVKVEKLQTQQTITPLHNQINPILEIPQIPFNAEFCLSGYEGDSYSFESLLNELENQTIISTSSSQGIVIRESESIVKKKGSQWTKDEHKLFLLGLKKYGKGDWKSISRNFVTTRSSIQVASHAQKFFNRYESTKKRKRISIHDITDVDNKSIVDLVRKGLLSPNDASTLQTPDHRSETRDAGQHGAQRQIDETAPYTGHIYLPTIQENLYGGMF